MCVWENNTPPAPVFVDGEPHDEPPGPGVPSWGYLSLAGGAPQAPTCVAGRHTTIVPVPLNIATAQALLWCPLAHCVETGDWAGLDGKASVLAWGWAARQRLEPNWWCSTCLTPAHAPRIRCHEGTQNTPTPSFAACSYRVSRRGSS